MNRLRDKEDLISVLKGILLSHEKYKILPFATIWMKLDGTMLTEIGREKQILYDITYM